MLFKLGCFLGHSGRFLCLMARWYSYDKRWNATSAKAFLYDKQRFPFSDDLQKGYS
jgi:hypothetical protein